MVKIGWWCVWISGFVERLGCYMLKTFRGRKLISSGRVQGRASGWMCQKYWCGWWLDYKNFCIQSSFISIMVWLPIDASLRILRGVKVRLIDFVINSALIGTSKGGTCHAFYLTRSSGCSFTIGCHNVWFKEFLTEIKLIDFVRYYFRYNKFVASTDIFIPSSTIKLCMKICEKNCKQKKNHHESITSTLALEIKLGVLKPYRILLRRERDLEKWVCSIVAIWMLN